MSDPQRPRSLNVFFDVDYTLISFFGTLRPHVREVFQSLSEDGHRVYIWSGVGLRHEVVRRFDLAPFVRGVYLKPLERYREMLPHLGVDVVPDFVVDDHAEVVRAFGGMHIRPYDYPSASDAEMLRAYALIREAADGRDGNEL